jgi:hypothetical protein
MREQNVGDDEEGGNEQPGGWGGVTGKRIRARLDDYLYSSDGTRRTKAQGLE